MAAILPRGDELTNEQWTVTLVAITGTTVLVVMALSLTR